MPADYIAKITDIIHSLATSQHFHTSYTEQVQAALRSGDVQFTQGPLHDLVSLTAWHTSPEALRTFLHVRMSKAYMNAWCTPFTDDTCVDEHFHNYLELIYVLNGSLKIRIGKNTLSFSSGEILLLNDHVSHCEYLNASDSIIICLDLDNSFFQKNHSAVGTFVNQKRSDYQYICFSPAGDTSELEEAFYLLIRELTSDRFGHDHIILGFSERIVDILLTDYHPKVRSEDKDRFHQYLLRDICSYISANFRTVTVASAAANFHYSADYLNRLFRKIHGQTLSEYIQHIRLTEALRLLQTTDAPVTVIMDLVGYHNQGFFYKKFKEKYGILPGNVKELYETGQTDKRTSGANL